MVTFNDATEAVFAGVKGCATDLAVLPKVNRECHLAVMRDVYPSWTIHLG